MSGKVTREERAAAYAIATIAFHEGQSGRPGSPFTETSLSDQFDEVYSYIRDAIDESAKDEESLAIASGEAAGEIARAIGLVPPPPNR